MSDPVIQIHSGGRGTRSFGIGVDGCDGPGLFLKAVSS
jgi:hypothetical protein